MRACAMPIIHKVTCRCDVSGVVIPWHDEGEDHFAGRPEGPLWVASFGLGVVFIGGQICEGGTGFPLGHRYALIHAADEEQARVTADMFLGHGNWASLAPEATGIRSIIRFGKEPLFRGPAGFPAVLAMTGNYQAEVTP